MQGIPMIESNQEKNKTGKKQNVIEVLILPGADNDLNGFEYRERRDEFE